jgi:hypothetical protein
MIQTIRRYARAFVLALRFTLRGEKPPLLKLREEQPDLAAWWRESVVLVEAIERAAVEHGVDPATVKLRVDRRDISMKTILATIRYHAERDYPYLIAHHDEHDQLALQSINLNDRYLVMQLGKHVQEVLKPAIEALGQHLAEPPLLTPTNTGK